MTLSQIGGECRDQMPFLHGHLVLCQTLEANHLCLSHNTKRY